MPAGAPITDYEKYVRAPELLSLQKSVAELSCHDEMQFQVVHQVAELWMKLIDHELQALCIHLDADRIVEGTATLRRVGQIQQLLLQQMSLLDTMAPRHYMTVREVLGRGSGQESPGFKRMLVLPSLIWPKFEALLQRAGASLRALHEDPKLNPTLLYLAEALIDYDQALQTWRQRHLMLVYRIIGTGTPSLKGKHSELLERGAKERFFPALWDVRDEVFGEWSRQMEARGEAKGYHG